MSVSEILTLIENVDPADTEKLDEIDAKVWCYLQKKDPEYKVFKGSSQVNSINQLKDWIPVPLWEEYSKNSNKYTRSRDALKAIRPKGFNILIPCISGTIPKIFHCVATKGRVFLDSDAQMSEELAELHAILQAIEYERKQNGMAAN